MTMVRAGMPREERSMRHAPRFLGEDDGDGAGRPWSSSRRGRIARVQQMAAASRVGVGNAE